MRRPSACRPPPCASPAPPGPICPDQGTPASNPSGTPAWGTHAHPPPGSPSTPHSTRSPKPGSPIFSEKISTRATQRPELDKTVALAGEPRAPGYASPSSSTSTSGLGRGIELAPLAEELKASDISLEFLTGELQGSHAPSGVMFTVLATLSGMEREYTRERTLEGHKSARKPARPSTARASPTTTCCPWPSTCAIRR
ncbi:recombinase family protein [Streptomyces sp. NPDC002088]|uniref:recombinase family protein n=1 Tax=Streptomyces sp. NPDC002088 TaxID=3154665 RepID=UPI003334A1D2